MIPNAWCNGARWPVGQRGAWLFEIGTRAHTQAVLENTRGGTGYVAVVERAIDAVIRSGELVRHV